MQPISGSSTPTKKWLWQKKLMIKKVHITALNKATFFCPACYNSKTVDVSKYKNNSKRTKVKSKCVCGCKWTSILERRNRYRLAVNIPCTCNHIGDRGFSENIPMKISNISSSGLRLESHDSRAINTSDYSLDEPIIVNFYLENQNKTHIETITYAKHIGKRHIGTAFDVSWLDDNTSIESYILSQS